MKVKYEFVNKETTVVEVSMKIKKEITELNRVEYNQNHKETRRHCTLSVMGDEGTWLQSEKYNPYKIKIMSNYGVIDLRLDDALEHLTDGQRAAIFAIYFDGYTMSEYADEMGITHAAVSQMITRAKKILKEFY